jgi:DNA-directed RNA polymerase specialized sigma24 family protein
MEVLHSQLQKSGRRRALRPLVLEAPFMAEVDNRKAKMKDAADLYWLTFLLTGRRDVSIDIAADAAASQDEGQPFFAAWMRAWSRRIVIAKALAAIRDELAESARRTELARVDQSAARPRDWSLSPHMNKSRIEEALLAIDVFPRAAVLLLVFEGVQIADAAALLDRDATLVRKAHAIGLREFTANLAGKDSRGAAGFSPMLALAQAH